MRATAASKLPQSRKAILWRARIEDASPTRESGPDSAMLQELITDAGMREVARWANGLGPDKNILAPVKGGQISYTTNFVSRCACAGLTRERSTFSICC